jgi:hypothetical protein
MTEPATSASATPSRIHHMVPYAERAVRHEDLDHGRGVADRDRLQPDQAAVHVDDVRFGAAGHASDVPAVARLSCVAPGECTTGTPPAASMACCSSFLLAPAVSAPATVALGGGGGHGVITVVGAQLPAERDEEGERGDGGGGGR